MATLRGADPRRPHPAILALAGLLIAAAVLLLYAGRHLTFFYDEWSFILDRRGGSVNAYLSPHNGHLSLVPVAIYKLLFATVGLRHYTPYRAVGIAFHLLCAALLYLLVRRRLGPWGGLIPTLLLLFLGSAWQDLLWPFQIGYFASVAGGLGALLLLDSAGAQRDLWAMVLLVLSVCSSGVGLAFLAGIAVLLIGTEGHWRRLLIVVVPAGVFVIWYLGWGTGEHITAASVLGTPQFVADAASSGVAGLAGLSDSWGPPLTVAGLIALALYARRRPPVPSLLAALVGMAVFWVLVGVTRSDFAGPTASRYVYVSAAFILVIASVATSGLTIRRNWLLVGILLLSATVIANLGVLREQERGLRSVDARVRAALGAVEIAAPVVAPGFAPDPPDAPAITAARYLTAVRELGSPALGVATLERAPESSRLVADMVLIGGERLTGSPVRSQPGGCSPQSTTPTVRPGGTLFLATKRGATTQLQLYVRRFADQLAPRAVATATDGERIAVHFPADRAPAIPWLVHLSGAAPAQLCVGA